MAMMTLLADAAAAVTPTIIGTTPAVTAGIVGGVYALARAIEAVAKKLSNGKSLPVRVALLERDSENFKEWLVKVEGKLDKVIEKR